MSGKLVAGLVLVAALLAGGVLGLLLIAPSGPGQPAPTPAPPPLPPTTSATESPDPADTAAVGVLAQALADALTHRDAAAFGRLTCRAQTAEALAKLQHAWDTAGPVTATLSQVPDIQGESASVTVHVVAPGGFRDTPFPLHKQDGRWCVFDSGGSTP